MTTIYLNATVEIVFFFSRFLLLSATDVSLHLILRNDFLLLKIPHWMKIKRSFSIVCWPFEVVMYVFLTKSEVNFLKVFYYFPGHDLRNNEKKNSIKCLNLKNLRRWIYLRLN